MGNRRKLVLFLFLVAAVLAVDQAGKALATEYLSDGVRHSYLGDFLRLEYIHNTGAILGLGSQLPAGIRRWFMPLSTVAILVWVGIMLIREEGFGWAAAGFSLVWGGGFANLIDRAAYGEVVDFFSLGFGAVRTGVSNLADVAIVVGIPLIIIGWLGMKPAVPEAGEGNGAAADEARKDQTM
ncbi:MAG: signal peptidase II [Anaerolineales bacterium]|nr:signal peptidase II [Anaerolineales bacterium]